MRAFSEVILFCAFVGTEATNSSAVDVERQAKMSTCELVVDMGYHCETWKAPTEDGYVVEIDRVGENISETHGNNKYRGVPIVLVPGMFYDSATWFINYPSQSAGFLLAHKGYDVWALNTREAVHRSSHKELNHSDPQYWQWSFDEIGRFDVAAAIDLVLSTTGASNLALLGFSQGFTSSLVLLSTNPDYNAKINLLMGYAPVANASHTGYPASPLVFLSDLLLEKPPEYPVKRINVPVALFSSAGDTVADPADVADLVHALGSTVVLDYVVPIRNFRHTDFVLGYNAADVLHDVMIAILSNYTSRRN
ncbi:hypothetical protein HPB50_025536 [Hyalomma asiaticum]|uniref:Uncharacterized protein n=1 Tax=Hyalomma asiaticum TaxID=266040 RepID=A0ACB7RSH6_HYAAI|nr:hypothetical protein HPB50_025536 [Hyalomma asiaticum]